MLWLRRRRLSPALTHVVSLVVPHPPALPPGRVTAPYRRPGGLDGQRPTHHDAHCAWDVLVAGRGAGRLPFPGRLDRLLAGWAWSDCRDAEIPRLRCRYPVSLCHSAHAICDSPGGTAVSHDGDHGSDIRGVQPGRLAVSRARDHDGYGALGLP